MVTTQLRVIYGDTDQAGIVYYANYLRYFEAGRGEFVRAKGLSYGAFERDFGLVLPVIEAHVSYRQPARYEDLLTVEITLAEAGRARTRFDYRILRGDGLLLATGHTVHACVDAGGRPRRIPKELLERLSAGEPGHCPAAAGPSGPRPSALRHPLVRGDEAEHRDLTLVAPAHARTRSRPRWPVDPAPSP